MKNVLRIIRNDFKGLIKNPVALLLIAAILVLPALYAWLNIYAAWDPYGNMDGIQVAIYTEDEDYMLDDGTVVNMSDDMMSELFAESSLTWNIVDSRDEAIDGVYDGTYYASVVIESDFTKSMFDFDNVGENEPTITFYQNQKKNAIATRMTDSACNTLRRCLSEAYIKALTMEVFGHFNGLNSNISGIKSDINNSESAFQNLKDNLNGYESTIASFINADKLLVKTVDETDRLVDSAVSSLYESADNMDRQSTVIEQIRQDLKKDTDKATDSIGTLGNRIDDLKEITDGIGDIESIYRMSEMLADTRDTLVETKGLLKDIQKIMDAAADADDNIDTMGYAMCDTVDYLLNETDKLLVYIDARIDEIMGFSADFNDVLDSAVTYNDDAAANQAFLVSKAGYSADSAGTGMAAVLLASEGYNLADMYSSENGAQSVNDALQNVEDLMQRKSEEEIVTMTLQAISDDPAVTGADSSVEGKINRMMNSASSIFVSIDRIQEKAGDIRSRYESIQKQLPGIVEDSGAVLQDAGMEYSEDTVRVIQASVNQILEDAAAGLNQVDRLAEGDTAVQADIAEARARIAEAKTMVNSIRIAFKDFGDNAPDVDADDTIKVLNKLLGDLDEVEEALESAQKLMDTTGDASEALAQAKVLADSTSEYINDAVWPKVNHTLDDMEKVMDEISALLVHSAGTMKDGKKVLGNVSLTMMGANNSLGEVQNLLGILKGRISPIIDDLDDMQDAEIISDLRTLLGLDPDAVSDYFASPVDTQTDAIYSLDNYGSGMAPFYTSIALWIGAIILAALFKTQPERKGLRKPKTWQLFTGRYFLFYVISQLQAMVIILGDLLLLRIQCEHPFLFILTGSMVALTFSILIYSLILCFGIMGKAIAILLFILQIACSGGTYPVELLPEQFSVLQKFLPFDYSIGAMRSCIAGVYQHDVAICYTVMVLIIVFSIVLGLRSRLFKGFVDYMDERMEDSNIMT